MIANGLPSILWWASDYQRKLKGQFRKRGICQKHSWQWIHPRTRLFKVTVTVPIVLSKGCCQRHACKLYMSSKRQNNNESNDLSLFTIKRCPIICDSWLKLQHVKSLMFESFDILNNFRLTSLRNSWSVARCT